MVELTIDTRELERTLTPLAAFPKEMQAAVYQSLKNTMTGARRFIRKSIRKHSTLFPAVVESAIGRVTINTFGDSLIGGVRVSSRPIHLSDYQIAPRRVTAQKGKRSTRWRPVRWRFERGSPFKENKKEEDFSRAFVPHNKGRFGELDVFRRKGDELQAQFGPRVQYFMAFENLQESLEDIAERRFETRLAREVNYRLSKLGG